MNIKRAVCALLALAVIGFLMPIEPVLGSNEVPRAAEQVIRALGTGGGATNSGSDRSGENMVKKGEIAINSTVAGKSEPGVEWDQCGGNIQGAEGKPDDKSGMSGQCGGGVKMSKALYEAMDKHFSACVEEALGCKQIFIKHAGCVHDRVMNTPQGGSTTPSLHATGRALDIYSIKCLPSGPELSMDQSHKGQPTGGGGKGSSTRSGTAYDQIRACWREKITQDGMCGGMGSIGFEGSAKGEGDSNNSKHNDHLHLQCSEGGK